MTRAELIRLLEAEPLAALMARADGVRALHCGDDVHVRGLIEFSNHCSRNCTYCGIRAGNASLPRYRLSLDEIRTLAEEAVRNDIRTFVLQSGEDPAVTADDIARMVEAVKSLGDVAVTLSSGEFPRDDYRRMRDAGADRYLIKFETSNELLYQALHPNSTLVERLRCVHDLRDLGFQTGSGSLVGLPGQTVGDIADDLLLAAELDLDMATFSPFIPHPNTPLAGEPGGTVDLGLRTVAAARLVMPDVLLPVSRAFATICDDGYRKGLRAGANVIMANLTPLDAAQRYELYPGKVPVSNGADRDAVRRVRMILRWLGRPVSAGRGDSLKRPLEAPRPRASAPAKETAREHRN